MNPASAEWQDVAARLSRGEAGAAAALLLRLSQTDVLPQSDRLMRPGRLWSAWAAPRR